MVGVMNYVGRICEKWGMKGMNKEEMSGNRGKIGGKVGMK